MQSSAIYDKTAIRTALENVEKGLKRYFDIQTSFLGTDVSKDRDFQRKFVGFYRVRRNQEWRQIYFDLLERTKTNDTDFDSILKELYRQTGRIEASFASKLVATRYPEKPVWDQYLLENLGLKRPGYHLPKQRRLEKSILLYSELERKMNALETSEVGQCIVESFDRKHPAFRNISNIKKLDLTLWQIR